MREGPDRANAAQAAFFLFVFVAPLLVLALRRYGRRVAHSVFVLQLLAYVAYETGVSDLTDNRADLFFIFAAIGLTYWLALGRRRPAEGSR